MNYIFKFSFTQAVRYIDQKLASLFSSAHLAQIELFSPFLGYFRAPGVKKTMKGPKIIK